MRLKLLNTEAEVAKHYPRNQVVEHVAVGLEGSVPRQLSVKNSAAY